MPRPERALDPSAGPVQMLAAELRDLRRRAGNPGYRKLAAEAGYSATALANAAGGRSLPSLPVTLAFVQACGGDPSGWERRWQQASAEHAAGQLPPASDEQPPYLGLIGYGAGDADRFFGRRRILAELLRMMDEHRFVAVFGASGSGKSSLLRAGMIPACRSEHVCLITPGVSPREALRPAATAGLLVVDQFEELFTHCADPSERSAFVDELATRRVVVGVRADFYARCAESAPLAGLLAGANLPVGPLTADELREVVTEPARRAGLSVERALVTKVVADAERQPGALPLVSHALLETWRQRRGDVLTVAGYEAAGGMSGAIAQTAESVFRSLDEPERETAREVLTRLVTLGEGLPDTRRRCRRDELDQPGADPVLAKLADARLLVLGVDTVEIAHEALIRAWPRLDDWLHADREELHLHRRLTEAGQIWQAHDRDGGALYRGALLAEWDGRSLQRLNATERSFLTASRDRRDREAATRRRRVRLALATLTAAVLVTSLLAGLAGVQAHRAGEQRDLARSSQLVANARAQAQVDHEVALLLAIEAYDTRPTDQAQAALRQAVADSRLRATLHAGQGQAVGVAWSPDGATVAAAGGDGTVRLWQRTGPDRPASEPRVLKTSGMAVQSPVFSPDGRRIAVAGFDHQITVWSLADGTSTVLRGHRDQVNTVAFSPDGRRLASASGDDTVRLWDPGPAANPIVLRGHRGEVWTLAGGAGGNVLASGGTDGTVRVWRKPWHAGPLVLRGNAGEVIAVAVSADGRWVASGGPDRTVRVWNAETGDVRAVLRGHTGTVYGVSFSPGGERLASSAKDGSVRVWSLAGDAPVVLRGHDGSARAVAFSPDDRHIASAGSDGTVRIWPADGAGAPVVVQDQPPGRQVWAVAFSPDGKRLAVSGQDGAVRIWAADGRGRPVALRGHRDVVWSVDFNADGGMVASSGQDGDGVRIWQAATGRELATVRGHGASVEQVRFLPGGELATAHGDGTVRLWRCDVCGPIAEVRARAGTLATRALTAEEREAFVLPTG